MKLYRAKSNFKAVFVPGHHEIWEAIFKGTVISVDEPKDLPFPPGTWITIENFWEEIKMLEDVNLSFDGSPLIIETEKTWSRT